MNKIFAIDLRSSSSTLRFRSTAIVLLFLSAIWCVAIYELTRSETNLVAQSEIRTQQQARALAEYSRSSFKRIDELLLDLRGHWTQAPKAFSRRAQERQQAISDIAFQVAVIDSKGFLLFSNLAPVTEKIDLHEREHFRVHAQKEVAPQN